MNYLSGLYHKGHYKAEESGSKTKKDVTTETEVRVMCFEEVTSQRMQMASRSHRGPKPDYPWSSQKTTNLLTSYF